MGEVELTMEEVKVLREAAGGFVPKETAAKLGVRLPWVLYRRKRILAKLGVRTMEAACVVAMRRGIVR